MKIYFRLSLLCLSFWLCYHPAFSNGDKKGQKVIKVMAYNVHHCNPPSAGNKIDMEAIAKVINAEKPDLVALQEIDVHTSRSGKELDQAAELGRLTGMKAYFSKGIDFGGGEYGVAVLSRFPIEETFRMDLPVLDGTKGEPRTIAAVTVKVSKKKKLIFASTHLDLKQLNRINQSNQIIEKYKDEKIPVIIAGDFNAVVGTEEMDLLDKHFVRTCVENCGGTIPVKNPNRTIDYIIFKPSKNFKVISHKVIDEQYASDHLPIVAELRLK